MPSACVELSPMVSPAVFLLRPISLSQNPMFSSLVASREYRRSGAKTPPMGIDLSQLWLLSIDLGEETAHSCAAAVCPGPAATRRQAEAGPGGRGPAAASLAAVRIRGPRPDRAPGRRARRLPRQGIDHHEGHRIRSEDQLRGAAWNPDGVCAVATRIRVAPGPARAPPTHTA